MKNPNKIQAIKDVDIEDKHVKTFLRWLAIYIMAVVVLTIVCIYDAFAQDINSLIPDDSISTEDVETRLESEIINQLDLIEKPSMDVEIKPEPPLIDFNAPNYLEMVRYRMSIAMVDRAVREGKPTNYYLDIFNQAWEREHADNKQKALNALREAVPCPNGFEYWPNSRLCNQHATHELCERHYGASVDTIFHLSKRNEVLEAKCGYGAPTAKICIDRGSIKDGSGGFLWKAEADPKARCKNGTTILLSKDFASITEIELLDVNQNLIFKPSYFGKLSDGRPRFCAEGRAGSSFSGPLYVKYGNDCKSVANPSQRED